MLGTFEWRGGGFDQFVRLIVPHGLLEAVACIALAGAAGLTIAGTFIDPGRSTRSDALAALVPQVGAMTLGTVLFLIVAGLTEGFITPWDLPLPLALGVGPGPLGVLLGDGGPSGSDRVAGRSGVGGAAPSGR